MFLDKIKEIFWPIERSEVKLFAPMALMMLCVLFNFGALRSIKDSLVVPSIGAEVISFLKLWLVLPASIIFTIIYVKLSNSLKFEYIFYCVISFFLLFFIFFGYAIFPNQEIYHPDPLFIEQISNSYPNLKWFAKIAEKWSYALMYVFCDLWSAVFINLMFWQFANNIFDTEKAKRFYPILGMVGNMGITIAGNVLTTCACQETSEEMLKMIILSIVIAGITSMMLFYFLNNFVLKEKDLKINVSSNDHKTRLSLKDSFNMILHSSYIGRIVILIMCYGLLINILEGPWKDKVRELYPSTREYMHFMGQFNIWMGVSCVAFMVIGSNVLRRFGWFFSAMLTPLMFLVTGTIFFAFVLFSGKISLVNPIYVAVLVGAVQNILSKSTKYSLFDATKEMAYIPLSLELKTKGKATVEVIGTKFGKSLGAFVQSSIFFIAPSATFDSITSYLIVVFVVIYFVWIFNVAKLNNEFLSKL